MDVVVAAAAFLIPDRRQHQDIAKRGGPIMRTKKGAQPRGEKCSRIKQVKCLRKSGDGPTGDIEKVRFCNTACLGLRLMSVRPENNMPKFLFNSDQSDAAERSKHPAARGTRRERERGKVKTRHRIDRNQAQIDKRTHISDKRTIKWFSIVQEVWEFGCT